MAFRHSFGSILLNYSLPLVMEKNTASQLNETIDVSAFKVLIENFHEQSSDLSPTFRYRIVTCFSKLLS